MSQPALKMKKFIKIVAIVAALVLIILATPKITLCAPIIRRTSAVEENIIRARLGLIKRFESILDRVEDFCTKLSKRWEDKEFSPHKVEDKSIKEVNKQFRELVKGIRNFKNSVRRERAVNTTELKKLSDDISTFNRCVKFRAIWSELELHHIRKVKNNVNTPSSDFFSKFEAIKSVIIENKIKREGETRVVSITRTKKHLTPLDKTTINLRTSGAADKRIQLRLNRTKTPLMFGSEELNPVFNNRKRIIINNSTKVFTSSRNVVFEVKWWDKRNIDIRDVKKWERVFEEKDPTNGWDLIKTFKDKGEDFVIEK